MAGLFETFGVNAEETIVPVAATGIPAGTHAAVISGVRLEENVGPDNDKTAMVISYKVEPYEFPKDEYFTLPSRPKPWDYDTVIGYQTWGDKEPYTEGSQNDWLMGLIKGRLISIGVPENRVNSVDPLAGDLDNVEVVITLVENKKTGYVNIARKDGVRPKKSLAQSLPTAAAPKVAEAITPAGFKPAWNQ